MTELAPTLQTKEDETTINPHKKIAAEAIFDRAIYGGISFAAQAGTGIMLSHWIKHGNGGKYFKQFMKAITGKEPENVSTTAVITFMVMVGNTFLIPVKLLENRKAKIVGWINEKRNNWLESRGNPVSEKEREEQTARLDYIEHHAPKQNWFSLGGGRAFALGVVFGLDYLIGEKRNAIMQKWSARNVRTGLGKLGFTHAAESKKVNNYLEIGFVDAFYSAISASGLYVYSHFIRPPKKHTPVTPAVEIDDESEGVIHAPGLVAPIVSMSGKNFAEKYTASKPQGNWQASVSAPVSELKQPSII